MKSGLPVWSASVRLMTAAVAPAGIPLGLLDPVTRTVSVAAGPSAEQLGPQVPIGPKGAPRVSQNRAGLTGVNRLPPAVDPLGVYQPLASRTTSTVPRLL